MEPEPCCELCGRTIAVTKHHLIPRTRHKNKANKKTFDRREVHERVAWLCRPCHSNVHALLTEKELERDYNTLEALREHPGVSKFSSWIATKATTRIPVRASRDKSR
jgi:hypothetical protein